MAFDDRIPILFTRFLPPIKFDTADAVSAAGDPAANGSALAVKSSFTSYQAMKQPSEAAIVDDIANEQFGQAVTDGGSRRAPLPALLRHARLGWFMINQQHKYCSSRDACAGMTDQKQVA